MGNGTYGQCGHREQWGTGDMGHISNEAHRGSGTGGMGCGGMGHMGNEAHRGMGYRGMGHMGNSGTGDMG